MRVHLGSDHAGLDLKDHLLTWLADHGYEAVDHGPFVYDAVDDYPVFCLRAAEAVAAERAEGSDSLGVVIGGSGNGEQIAANKVIGIRSALVWSEETAVLARQDSGLFRPRQCRADPDHLVGGHLLAVAGPADHDAEAVEPLRPLRRDGLGGPQAEDRVVVDGVVDERSVVHRLEAVLGEPGDEMGLQVQARMVGAEVHAHGRILSEVGPEEPCHLPHQRLRLREHLVVPPGAVPVTST